MHCYVFRIREVERGEENLNNNSTNQKVPADNSGILRRWLHTLRRHLMMMLRSTLRFRVPSMDQMLPGWLVAGEAGEGGDRTLCCLSPPQADPLHAAGAAGAARLQPPLLPPGRWARSSPRREVWSEAPEDSSGQPLVTHLTKG